MSKSTQSEVEIRISHVIRMLVEGYSKADIVRYAAENWGVKERQTEEYIKRASGIIKGNNSEERELLISMQMQRFTMLFNVAFKKEDINAARLCLSDINKMYGLNFAEKDNLNNNQTIWDEYREYKERKADKCE